MIRFLLIVALCCALLQVSHSRTTTQATSSAATPTTVSPVTTQSAMNIRIQTEAELQDLIFQSMFSGIRQGISRLLDTVSSLTSSSSSPFRPSSFLSSRLVGIKQEISNLFDVVVPGTSLFDPSGTTQSVSSSEKPLPTTVSQTTPSSAPQSTTSASQTTSVASQSTTTTGTVLSSTSPADGATGTPAVSTTSPAQQVTCPQGTFNRRQQTVTFILEERECEITVYLEKPPKSNNKGKKGKKPKGPKGKANADKHIIISPRAGSVPDMCPDSRTQMYGKDTFVIETNECIMIISKDKGKGRSPSIISRSVS